jgi:hypothetical protein
MNRVGLGVGLIATVLAPVALLLFGILGVASTLSAILLLSGVWTLAFGLTMEAKAERLYYSGSGVVVALLSTFRFVSLAYTAGLVVVAFVMLALVSALLRPGPAAPQKP